MLISAKIAPVFAWDVLEEFWTSADELGFHAVWNYDHFYGLGDITQDTFEGWTSLAAMATIVKRARIGCMVTGVTYRNPGVLAKMAVTVDHISGGRLDIGLGAAWHEPEHRAFGIPFPSAGTRIAMLDEALTAMRRMFTEDSVTFEGEHYRFEGAFLSPKPVQRPHPPIVVGGSGRKKMLRVVATHANEWNTPGQDPAEWAELNGVLDEHCKAVGRDPREIRRGVQLFLHPGQEGQLDAQIEKLPAYEEAGCEHVVLSFYAPPTRAQLERVAPR